MILLLAIGGVFLAVMFSLFRSLFVPKSMLPGFDRGTAAVDRFIGRVFFLGVVALIVTVVYFVIVQPQP